jgi:hypothetical protein
MADRTPVETTNLDIYGHAVIPWKRPHDLLASGPSSIELTFFLGTMRPDGRPHSAGVGAQWHDGEIYMVMGPGTRKARNLAANPAGTISVKLEGIDLVLEGMVSRVTDKPTLEMLAQLYRDGGWPAEVQGDAFTAPYSAPSAGPPPWNLYRLTIHTAFGPTGSSRLR